MHLAHGILCVMAAAVRIPPFLQNFYMAQAEIAFLQAMLAVAMRGLHCIF